MERVSSSGSDLNSSIDLEGGGTTSDEEANKGHDFLSGNSKNHMGRMRSGFTGSKSPYFSSSSEDLLSSDTSGMNREQVGKYREDTMNFVDEKEDGIMQKFVRPSKPPRPPKGPSWSGCDMKLLKEISELNSKRRRRKRIRMLKKIKKKNASPFSGNGFCCLVTLSFVLIIVFQGILGSRM